MDNVIILISRTTVSWRLEMVLYYDNRRLYNKWSVVVCVPLLL